MGWHDRKDILIWIQQIVKKDPNAEIEPLVFRWRGNCNDDFG